MRQRIARVFNRLLLNKRAPLAQPCMIETGLESVSDLPHHCVERPLHRGATHR